MSYISHASAMTVNGNTWWVNARKSGLFTRMAKRMIGEVEAMLEHHNKIHIIRFDLRQPTYTPDNRHITDFNRRLHSRLKVKYQLTRIGFMWAREREKAKQQHYHYVLILDGNKVQHPHHIQKIAQTVWEHMDGSVGFCKNCYYNICRNDHQKLQAAILRISYLAKGRGKGYRPPQTKDYSTSRIATKQKTIHETARTTRSKSTHNQAIGNN